MVAQSIIDSVQYYLRLVNENGIPVSFGVLFGSQAKGIAHKESDIDLLVVSPHFDGHKEYSDVAILWRLTARSDNRLEPVPVGKREWDEDTSRAVVEIARREGRIVEV